MCIFGRIDKGEGVYNCGGRWVEVVYNVRVVGDSGILRK
jgi:hypothetical protein